jgi:Ca2+-binding RTX toxin-like protein
MALVSAAMLLAAPVANAQDHAVDGIRADIRQGTLVVKGDDQANRVSVRLKAGDPSVVEVDAGDNGSADYSFARADVDAISVKMGDGDDSARVDDSNGSFTNTIPTTIAGGDGDDRLGGGLGGETFRGGDGNDTVIGGKGADTGYLGDGDDTFRWDNGDGSDVVEGQDGNDTMLFNGAAGAENVTVSAKGHRAIFFRQQGNVTMDNNGVEVLQYNALGGQDTVTVGDLSGTDVAQTNIDLGADNAADSVTVNGTAGDDSISVTGNGSGADVTGLASAVSVTHADPTLDVLAVNTLAGNDHVAVAGVAGLLQLLVDGVPS